MLSAHRKRKDHLLGLVRELRGLPGESEWVEFKSNLADPRRIGEYVSALANGAALVDRAHGYLLWGVENESHAVVGTNFAPQRTKAPQAGSNEPLETWLARLLEPGVHVAFHELESDGKRIVLLEVPRATRRPASFAGVEYVRVGGSTKKLKAFPERERALWRAFDRVRFEEGVAAERIGGEDVLLALNHAAYFDLLNVPPADGRDATLDALRRDGLIAPCDAGGFNVTNLGAILFARDLRDFPPLARKALRIVAYEGADRLQALGEHEETKGYAAAFDGLMDYLSARLPSREVAGRSFQRAAPDYPPVALRELIANALIHQDFSVAGAGPMVELFQGRIEITNPGGPLVDTMRFLDSPPASRNETLASLMRRLDICEERGSGIDKVVAEVEERQLPAPLFETPPGFTRAVLYGRKPLGEMDRAERVRACYQHACLKRITGGFLTNASLRQRFGIKENNRAVISRHIREATSAGLIVPFDANAGRRMMKYLPYWARDGSAASIDSSAVPDPAN